MTVASPYAVELARLPVTTRTLALAGSSTHVWEYGAAGADEAARADADTVLIVVHGFRGDHHGLEPVIAQLGDPASEAARGRRIVAPDLPGFGDSGPLAGDHDVDGYVAWLRELVDRVRRESPNARLVVVGHSFGSIVSSAALAGGLEVDDAVLINPISAPALKGPKGVMTRLAIGYYWFSAAVPEKLGFALLRSALVVRIVSITMSRTKDRHLLRWIHDQHSRYFSAFASRSVVLDAFRGSVSHDVSEYAAQVTVPTLLIAADDDDITPLAAQHEVQRAMPDARLVVLENVGHLIHYERPVEAAAAIEAFLAEERPA
ncbi:alpha/beta fold hydrolase [Herbiconiux sp. KACC 21604]|uniref:alpha/beta fold hydrolase n=1 Tax=unclassified Herbiconiux TaxID=2618217 RepID=UPI001491A5CD|nr:alpha/beta fold hydrolase [Herbiconiux sp. SALV-R1]QJU53530.1 alpha/beta fold hydrolase [Herbiconiux sp. SALV-R1]WPO88509.1 alpha/beta fold hydrolase [Herbiconiux sp. KACC 21604]